MEKCTRSFVMHMIITSYLKNVVISGKLAEQICDTMDIPCPEDVTFEGRQTIKTGEIYYEGSNLGKIYNFKITDDGQLSYVQDGNT